MDIGTGWFHHDAFLVYLVGDYRVYLFDVDDKARLRYMMNYFSLLQSKRDVISSELGVLPELVDAKLSPLTKLKTRKEIYDHCNFIPCIIDKPTEPFLPDGSIDFMLSNCVLGHIPPRILKPELVSLRKMLKPIGYMYHMIGHDDHWSFHDRSFNFFNYYRYSDRLYHLLFDNKFEYQNRMVRRMVRLFSRVRTRCRGLLGPDFR